VVSRGPNLFPDGSIWKRWVMDWACMFWVGMNRAEIRMVNIVLQIISILLSVSDSVAADGFLDALLPIRVPLRSAGQ
jgi:hypothetical protein